MFPHGVRHIIPHSSFVNSERRRGRRPKGTCAAWWVLRLASACWALAKNKANCLEGNTMSNRGAYSTKERMPSDINLHILISLEGCTWLVMYCPPGSSGDWRYIPRTSSFSLVCTGLRIVLSSRQFRTSDHLADEHSEELALACWTLRKNLN